MPPPHPAKSASKAQGKRAGTSLLGPGVYGEEPPLFPPAPANVAPVATGKVLPSSGSTSVPLGNPRRAAHMINPTMMPSTTTTTTKPAASSLTFTTDQGSSHASQARTTRVAPQSSLVPPVFSSMSGSGTLVPPPSPTSSEPVEGVGLVPASLGTDQESNAATTNGVDVPPTAGVVTGTVGPSATRLRRISNGSRGRQSSVDSIATATDTITHTSLDERPQFETISQIRASLAELEQAYSAQPARIPLSGRIIHVGHYIPFVIRSLAEVDYEQRQRQQEEARNNVAVLAAQARARRAAREAEERREKILADMHNKMSDPNLSAAARRDSIHQAVSRMAINGLEGQDMFSLLEENQARSKARAGRRAWMVEDAIDDDDDELDVHVDELKDRFTPIGSRRQSSYHYPNSRHGSFGATTDSFGLVAPLAPLREKGSGQAASQSSDGPSASTDPTSAPDKSTSTSAQLDHSDENFSYTSSQWVLTPRRGHTALNSGVRSLCKTHKQTFIGWPGDIVFPIKARGDTRTEPSQLTEEEKAQIEKALGELEDPSQWSSRLAHVVDAPKDSNGDGPISRVPTPKMNGADPIKPASSKSKAASETSNQSRYKVFRTVASAAKEERREELEEEEHLDGHEDYGIKYVPVWMESVVAHGFYEGYCKTVLWPLLHYLLWEDVNPVNGSTWDDSTWELYRQANQAYAERIAQEYKPGDVVIVHDYHLLLVPKMLRQLIPEAHITLFMHAPFPSSEVFRCLPKRTEILEGMLGADLACFQAFSYSRHFLSSCIRVCGFDASYNAVESKNGQVTSISYNPIGIDAAKIAKDSLSQGVKPKIEAFQRMYAGKKIIVGRDKLDVVRGVLQKLQAFKKLLDEYPEWRGQVVLIQVTAPAVHDSPALEREVSELVSQINSEYGTLSFAPVHHYHQIIDRDEYFALLSVADLALVTSVRDGMNTTSMEYVICQEQYGKKSPLVLSEFTGTASRMRTAIQVNPWNIWGVAKAINEGLTLSAEDRAYRHRHAYDQVTLHTSHTWAATLVRQLVYRLHVEETSHLTPELDLKQIQSDWIAAGNNGQNKRLIMLDYDGTLTPIVRSPENALPSPRLINTLAKLSADPRNVIFIISGRDQEFLGKHLGHLDNIGFSAEHGCFIKEPGKDQPWINIAEEFDLSWKGDVRAIFEYYTERTTGSHVEEKKCAITWHYRGADPDYGFFQAKECQAHLETMLEYNDLQLEVMVGKKNLEVRPLAINKGEIVKRLLAAHSSAEFVFCAGDDKTDEDMFRALAAVNRETTNHLAHSITDVDHSRSPSSLMVQESNEEPHPESNPDLNQSILDSQGKTQVSESVASSVQGDEASPTDLDEEVAPHPWEAAMAIAATSRGSTSHHTGPTSPLLNTDTNLHPFSLYTVTVGPATKKTIGQWHVEQPENVIDVLTEFAAVE
uniref:Trehalose-6-phosphate phosphatase2 n=1 Tax=Moniliella megachiliensis TaxID=203381 RepID=A0A024F967_9BASI|nr:trehalose-6-phosphate phosphatase2 [Moniliella megachiliensis]